MSVRALVTVAVAALAFVAALLWLQDTFAVVGALVLVPVALLVVVAAAGYGLLLIRVLRIDAGSDAAWIAVPLGVVVMGHVQALCAALDQFNFVTSLAVVAVGCGLALAHRRWIAESRPLAASPASSSAPSSASSPSSRAWPWALASSPFVLLVVGFCCAPPTYYDALVYHLGLVDQYIARGGSVLSSHFKYAQMPLTSELTSSTALVLTDSHEAMSLVLACLFVVLVVGGAATAARLFGAHAAGPAALVFASMPIIGFLAPATKCDLNLALLFLVALRALAPGRADARLFFLALGMTLATKFTAILIAFPLALVALLLPSVRRAWFGAPRARRDLVVGLLAGAAMGAPVYLRNLVLFHNPTMPFGSSWFGGPAWIATADANVAADAYRASSLGDVVTLLQGAFFSPYSFSNDVLGPATIAALFAPLVAWLVPSTRKPVIVVACALVATLPVWLLSHALPRYNPVLWVAVALLAAVVVAEAMRTRAWPVVAALVAACALACASWSLRANDALLRNPSRYLVGVEERDAFLTRVHDGIPAYRAAAAEGLPVRCLFIATGEPRLAYLRVPAVLSEVYMQPPVIAVLSSADPLAALRRTGATHVLVDDRAAASYAKRRWTLDEARLAELTSSMRVVWQNEHTRLLEVPSPVEGECNFDEARVRF